MNLPTNFNSLPITANFDPLKEEVILPSVKKLFMPDFGFTLCDSDLAQADVQVVAAESNDDILREIFSNPNKDLHDENTKMIFGSNLSSSEFKKKRKLAKMAVHLTNYGGKPPTLASGLGMSIADATAFQKKWFSIHPNIKEWHNKIENQLHSSRTIKNAFGNRRVYNGRIDHPTALNEALAWIPQSTVGLVINRAWLNIWERFQLKDVQVLLQVHDSLVYQVKDYRLQKLIPEIHDCFNVIIPYEKPLVIEAGLSISDTNWNDVQDVPWTFLQGH